jgi:hypothetical protein
VFSQAPSTFATGLRESSQRQYTLAANLRVFPQAPNTLAAALQEILHFVALSFNKLLQLKLVSSYEGSCLRNLC